MRLTERYEVLADRVVIRDCAVAVDLAFDVVLKVLELLADEAVGAWFKLDRSLDLLLPDLDRSDLSVDEQYEVFSFVLESFIKEEAGYNSAANSESGSGERFMDFTKDAGLLFASFYQAYGMDLFEQQGKLHWRKFQKLLLHLPQDTAFKEVIGYRQMAVPSSKEASADYIKHVRQMKRLYRLDEDTPVAMDDKLSAYAAQFGGD